MALALLIILFLFGLAACFGLHALADAVGFWPYILLCFGGGSLMIAAVWAWEQLYGYFRSRRRRAAP